MLHVTHFVGITISLAKDIFGIMRQMRFLIPPLRFSERELLCTKGSYERKLPFKTQ